MTATTTSTRPHRRATRRACCATTATDDFADVAAAAGVAGGPPGSTAAACDLNNDGYRELYLGTASGTGTDRLLLNNWDGTFSDITGAAFGSASNHRAASSVACADVDGDGWLDVYVGNAPEQPGPVEGSASLPRIHNALYLNNGDLTFDEVAEAAGVRGGQVTVRGLDGQPILVEQAGNSVGEPSRRMAAVLFFDHDDDGDPDLWVASDGDRLRVYRNDSSPGRPRFTPVARDLGVDRIGNWRDIAVGDFDGDADLDVLVVNGGLGSLSSAPPEHSSRDCAYHARFSLGTCHHMLLRNDGVIGEAPFFADVAGTTTLSPATGTPGVIEQVSVHPFWPSPTGLAAYPLGTGPAFLDVDNDADQDLLWPSKLADAAAPASESWLVLRAESSAAFEAAVAPAPPGIGNPAAIGDLDGDGYTDLVAAPGESDASALALISGGGGNNWLTLRLVGRTVLGESGSNADGVGARVYVVTRPDPGAPPVVQVREVRAGSGLTSTAGAGVEFGLSGAASADTVLVFWPSGREQRLSGVAANQVLEIVEPSEE